MAEPGRLDGKIALVTGAASGIGAATARLFAAEGARVVLTDLDMEAGSALAATLDRVDFLRHDVTSEADWERVMADTQARYGGLDVLVNNAGVMPVLKTIEETDYAEWKRVVAVNLDGVFLGVKHGIRAMKRRGGAIVNMSSIMGLVGETIVGAYGASKGGVRILTKSAAIECAALGYPIRINSVHPGYIDGGMFAAMADTLDPDGIRRRFAGLTPMKRLGRPEEIAKGVLFLATDDASFATGTELVLDGGYTAR